LPHLISVICWTLGTLPSQGAGPQFVWQGQVSGIASLQLRGKHLVVQSQSGGQVENQKFHFSDALPDSGQKVRLEVLQGRGYVHVMEQPGIENHYTLVVEIEDRQAGSAPYSIALYWDTSTNNFERGAPKTEKLTWSGRVEHSAVVDCQKLTCMSHSEHGTPAADEHFKFTKPLPDRDTEVRLETSEGRGEVQLIQQPRESNQYTARIAIHDPVAGVTDYSFTLVWNRVNSKEPEPIPEPTGRGFLWRGKVDGRVQVTVQGGASFSQALGGERVIGEHAEMVRPLPARSDLMPVIRKLQGRGQVALVEPPSEKNNYRLVFEIDDPEPGADDYEVELDW
jgi:hypothetical protein